MNLSLITKQLIGLEYELGKMDCFSLIINYLKIRGYDIPENFKGLTMETYKDFYLNDPGKAKKIMVEFIESLLIKIKSYKAFAGDILLLSYKGALPFLAIDGGNGTIIAASEQRGVSPTSKRHYTVEGAFRCQRP